MQEINISKESLDLIKQYKRYKRRVEEVISFFNDIATGDYTVERINEFITAQNNLLAETKVPAQIKCELIEKNATVVMDLGIIWDKDYAQTMSLYAIILETE